MNNRKRSFGNLWRRSSRLCRERCVQHIRQTMIERLERRSLLATLSVADNVLTFQDASARTRNLEVAIAGGGNDYSSISNPPITAVMGQPGSCFFTPIIPSLAVTVDCITADDIIGLVLELGDLDETVSVASLDDAATTRGGVVLTPCLLTSVHPASCPRVDFCSTGKVKVLALATRWF